LEDDAQQHGKSQPRSYASTPEPIPMAEGTGSGRGAARVRLGRDGPVTAWATAPVARARRRRATRASPGTTPTTVATTPQPFPARNTPAVVVRSGTPGG